MPRRTTPTQQREEGQPRQGHPDVRGASSGLRAGVGGRADAGDDGGPAGTLDEIGPRGRYRRPAAPDREGDGEADHRDGQADHGGIDRRIAGLSQFDARHVVVLSGVLCGPSKPRRQVRDDPGDVVGQVRGLRPGQPGDVDKGSLPGLRLDFDPQASTPHEERQHQAGDRDHRPGEGELLARVVGDLERGPPLEAGELHGAGAAGQRPRLAGSQRLQVDLLHPRRVQLVDALRNAAVQAEVAREGGQEDGRVVRGGEGREPAPHIVQGRGRQEHPVQAERGLGVRHLHDSRRGEVAVLWQEHHRVVEGDVTRGVRDDEVRCVAVTDQEHLHRVDGQRLVDLDRGRRAVGLRRRSVGDVGLEEPGGAALGGSTLEVDGEPVEGEREGRQGARVDEPAAAPGVVLRQGVGESRSLLDDDVALPAEQATVGDGQQDDDQGEMERQVAGLAQVALLGRHPDAAVAAVCLRRLAATHPPAPGLQVLLCHGQGVGAVGLDLELRGHRQPHEPAGSRRWRRQHRPRMRPGARQHAADQRDEQQEVHRGEPRRRVDVEEAEAVQGGADRGVPREPLVHAQRVRAPLREDRAGDAGKGEQEQQDQRRPHARQLTPRPAQQAHRTKGGISRHSGVWKDGIWTRSQIVKSVHSPVTRRMPTRISIPPPIRMTQT